MPISVNPAKKATYAATRNVLASRTRSLGTRPDIPKNKFSNPMLQNEIWATRASPGYSKPRTISMQPEIAVRTWRRLCSGSRSTESLIVVTPSLVISPCRFYPLHGTHSNLYCSSTYKLSHTIPAVNAAVAYPPTTSSKICIRALYNCAIKAAEK